MAKKKSVSVKETKNTLSVSQTELQKAEQELAEFDVMNPIDGIERCCGRLRKLIQLDAPLAIINNEIRIIQYRALFVQSGVEILQEIKARRLK